MVADMKPRIKQRYTNNTAQTYGDKVINNQQELRFRSARVVSINVRRGQNVGSEIPTMSPAAAPHI